MSLRAPAVAIGIALLVAACASGAADVATDTMPRSTPAGTTEPPPSTSPPPSTTAASPTSDLATIADAAALALAVDPRDGTPWVAWTTTEDVRIAPVDIDAGTVGPPVIVSGDRAPIPNVLERPAIAVRADGTIDVAFTSFEGAAGTVQLSAFRDGEVTGPAQISGTPRPETNLVHMTESGGGPTLAWLEDSSLSVGRPDGRGHVVEDESVDAWTCDCCNPSPVVVDDALVVAYRDRDEIDGRTVRDIAAVRLDRNSTTGDASTVEVADQHWFLEGCPFTGASTAVIGDGLLVAWSDGRQNEHTDGSTTIWIDASSDGARSFGVDRPVTDPGDGRIHRWPILAVDPDDGATVHLVWEVQEVDGGIALTTSHDRGTTFSAAHLIAPNDESSGQRRSPSAVVTDDRLVVSFVDRNGGHVASVPLETLRP